jgi:hypothetical protein
MVRMSGKLIMCHPNLQLYLISENGDKQFWLAKESSHTFSRHLLLLDRMVIDHLKTYYKEALDNIVMDKTLIQETKERLKK